jgi:hypothetical protein
MKRKEMNLLYLEKLFSSFRACRTIKGDTKIIWWRILSAQNPIWGTLEPKRTHRANSLWRSSSFVDLRLLVEISILSHGNIQHSAEGEFHQKFLVDIKIFRSMRWKFLVDLPEISDRSCATVIFDLWYYIYTPPSLTHECCCLRSTNHKPGTLSSIHFPLICFTLEHPLQS